MIIRKLKKKKLKLILERLYNVQKNVERYDHHGICNNLYLKVDDTDTVESFIWLCFEKKYGDAEIAYPIGDSAAYHADKDKWNPDSEYGKQRLELLDFMISECEELIK